MLEFSVMCTNIYVCACTASGEIDIVHDELEPSLRKEEM